MKTCILVYDGFTQFEVILAAYLLKTKGEIITAGLDKKPVTSYEGFQIIPDTSISKINADKIDMFIIPGGSPDKLYKNEELYNFIIKINNQNKKIAAICSGVLHLAACGILNNKNYTTSINPKEFDEFKNSTYVEENVVTDGNIITAKAEGYVDFAIQLGKIMKIYENEEDLNETIKFFKYFNEK